MKKQKRPVNGRNKRSVRRGGIPAGAFAALLVLLAGILLAACPVSGEESIYRDVIRLHILAASDDPEDQADKIAVRDAILSGYGDYFRGFADREAASSALSGGLCEQIRATAEKTLSERGKPSAVTVVFSEEEYPTREYGTFSLPAGRYLSLRVVIGTGEGKNWWCVLFPPLCTAASIDGAPLGLSDAEYRLITEGKKNVRFKTLELFSRWFS